jgi:hypothetical protein
MFLTFEEYQAGRKQNHDEQGEEIFHGRAGVAGFAVVVGG